MTRSISRRSVCARRPSRAGSTASCVCAAQAGQDAPALKQPPAAPTAPKEAEPEAAEVIRPKAAPAPIDCDSPQVQACLTKAKKMANRTYVPIDGLPTLTPASGEFNVTIVEISDYECPFCRRKARWNRSEHNKVATSALYSSTIRSPSISAPNRRRAPCSPRSGKVVLGLPPKLLEEAR